nr:immunoglobulin light chain junction region [Macaca mulatta]
DYCCGAWDNSLRTYIF